MENKLKICIIKDKYIWNINNNSITLFKTSFKKQNIVHYKSSKVQKYKIWQRKKDGVNRLLLGIRHTIYYCGISRKQFECVWLIQCFAMVGQVRILPFQAGLIPLGLPEWEFGPRTWNRVRPGASCDFATTFPGPKLELTTSWSSGRFWRAADARSILIGDGRLHFFLFNYLFISA